MASRRTTLLLCISLVTALQFGEYVSGLSTDPPTENGGTAVVAALENATNVSVFCAVTFGGGSTAPRVKLWYITTIGGLTRELILTSVPNFVFAGTHRENLTILSFGRNLDMGRLECNNDIVEPNQNEKAFFSLRIIR